VRTCPNPRCGQESPLHVDWCPACGEYLRWEATGMTPLPGPDEPPAVEPAANPQRTRVMTRASAPVELALPGVAGGALAVAPGESTSVRLIVHNRAPIPDTFQVVVDGMPAEWWTVAPAAFTLDGAGDAEVTVTLHPPRLPAARAGDWRIRFVAFAGVQRVAEVARTAVTATIGGFDRVETALAPGRRRGRFTLRLHNAGNRKAVIGLAASDEAGRCAVALAQERVELHRDESAEVEIRARPPRRALGRTSDHRLAVTVAAPGEPLPPLCATFTRRGWLRSR
jgi:hypothetical protein